MVEFGYFRYSYGDLVGCWLLALVKPRIQPELLNLGFSKCFIGVVCQILAKLVQLNFELIPIYFANTTIFNIFIYIYLYLKLINIYQSSKILLDCAKF